MRQLTHLSQPAQLSVLQFDLATESVHLSYCWAHRDGPGIYRDGQVPSMLIDGERTTHQRAMRKGTWLARDELRQAERDESALELRDFLPTGFVALGGQDSAQQEPTHRLLKDTLEELDHIPAHDRVFQQLIPGRRLLAQLGCGALSMNAWSVGFVNDALAQTPARQELTTLADEPLHQREYFTLLKWHANARGVERYSMELARFARPPARRGALEILWDDHWIAVQERIAFALTGQPVVRDGCVVPVREYCDNFADFRHLLRLINLNPDTADPLHDVWLGEFEMQKDAQRNVLRAALDGEVWLPRPEWSGVQLTEVELRAAFDRHGYREAARPGALAAGFWCATPNFIAVHFKRAVYPWCMVGLSADGLRMYWLTCDGDIPQHAGFTIEQAAQILVDAGAEHAVLVAQGYDAFQAADIAGTGRLIDPLQRAHFRRRTRATLLASVAKT
jgi:hypothetical protein